MQQGLCPGGLALGGEGVAGETQLSGCQAWSPPTQLPQAACIRLRKSTDKVEIDSFEQLKCFRDIMQQ